MNTDTVETMNISDNLAARYRPRRFAELTGQRHAAAIITTAICNERLPQQLLFTGGSGLGKTTVARIAAAALLCQIPIAERDKADACGECPSCLLVGGTSSTHPDVLEMDAASHGGKDEIVELVARSQTLPVMSRYKVYIVDEVHALSGSGVQAFLKLLEEPPAHVIFMLATTNPEKLSSRAGGAGTIRGRCLEIELVPPSREQLIDNLLRIAQGESWQLSYEQAGRAVDATDPRLGVRGTVNMLARLAGRLAEGQGVTDEEVDDFFGGSSERAIDAILQAVKERDLAQALSALDKARIRADDRAIREALASAYRRDLEKALVGQLPVAPQVPLVRLEAVLNAKEGRLHTDLLVARLAEPRLTPDPDAVAAQLHEAQRLLDMLATRLALLEPTCRHQEIAPSSAKDRSAEDFEQEDLKAAQQTATEDLAATRIDPIQPVTKIAGDFDDLSDLSSLASGSEIQGIKSRRVEAGEGVGGRAASEPERRQSKGVSRKANRGTTASDTKDKASAEKNSGREELGLAKMTAAIAGRSKLAAAVWETSQVDVAAGQVKVTPLESLRDKALEHLPLWRSATGADITLT